VCCTQDLLNFAAPALQYADGGLNVMSNQVLEAFNFFELREVNGNLNVVDNPALSTASVYALRLQLDVLGGDFVNCGNMGASLTGDC
jgi:hypothetical protein